MNSSQILNFQNYSMVLNFLYEFLVFLIDSSFLSKDGDNIVLVFCILQSAYHSHGQLVIS